MPPPKEDSDNASREKRWVPSGRFWDRTADRYAAKPVADEAAYRKKLAITREYLNDEMNVLELGCGTGSTALEHAPFVRHIRATDLSARMIEIANGKAKAAGVENVSFEQAALEELDVADSSVDVVLALSFLHLVDDLDAAFAKIHRMLKPGGLLISSTACIGDRMKWFGLIAPLGRWLRLLPLVKVFTKRQFIESMIKPRLFSMEQQWQPAKAISIFTVARKSGGA